jgi:RHS repeat-associated protein
MRSLKNLIVPSVISLIFLFSISYAMKNTYESIEHILYSYTITPPEPEIYNARDVSSSFNESGYSKSNSVSFDEKEVVNDFNGNLMYKIPITQAKGQGDLYYDISLNYNGNIGYQIIAAQHNQQFWLFNFLHMYNFNAPGWVLSVNGLAVQMLNFETNYFTKPTNGNEVWGNYIRLIAPGYHYNKPLTSIGGGDRDKITVMMGDGSTETLENQQLGKTSGNYRSTSLNSYLIAEVYYTPEPNKYRKMFLMKGDGLTYIYEEKDIKYKDNYFETGMAEWFKPKSFLLVEIKDRFGHVYPLDYAYQDALNNKTGRPWLTSCPGMLIKYAGFWGSYFGIKFITNDMYYYLYTDIFGTDEASEHKPMLNKIISPTGEQMTFTYETYQRTGTHIYNPLHTNGNNTNMTFKFGGYSIKPLYRMKKAVNYDGGSREYTYAGDNFLQISYEFIEGQFAHSTSYLGQGRDLFFSNMLSSIVVKNDDNSTIRTENFGYNYVANRSNVFSNPIDSNDEYVSQRDVISGLTGTNYSTPTSHHSKKLYRNYKIKATTPVEGITSYDGEIKIVKEDSHVNQETSPYKTINMNYYYSWNSTSEKFEGTFLNKGTLETRDGILRYSESYYEGGGYNPLTLQRDTDPLGRVTETAYDNYADIKFPVYKDGIYMYRGITQLYDTTRLYLIHLPTSIVTKKNDTVLYKKTFEYYTNQNIFEGNIPGYSGQLKIEAVKDPVTDSDLQSTSYYYYNRDTLGNHLYSQHYSNPWEGNLMQTIDPKGNVKKYYYDVITRKEDALFSECNETDEINCPPSVSYRKLFDNGTNTLTNQTWRDFRLPSRIDRYVNSTRHLTNYQLYNGVGQPTKMINENNYLSQVYYGKFYRVNAVVLPFDFNSNNETPYIDPGTNTVVVEFLSSPLKMGQRNELTGENIMFDITSSSIVSQMIDHEYTLGDSPERMKNLLIKFNPSQFANITSIDSAFLEFAPSCFQQTLTDTEIDQYTFGLKVVKAFGTGSAGYTEGNSDTYGNLALTRWNENICSNIAEDHNDNFRRINIKDLLIPNLDDGLEIAGLKFTMAYNGSASGGILKMFMGFRDCPTEMPFNIWQQAYAPRLRIYGKYTFNDTIFKSNYSNTTINYSYDDVNNKVSILNKIDMVGSSARNKLSIHFFDGFGKLKESRLYTGPSVYNTSQIFYNYLDGKAKTIDGVGNETEFSYDKYGNLSKTQHPDDSVILVSNTYQSSLTTEYYTISGGFVNKQEYTDETKRKFIKYFDAVGNLLREEKTVAGNGSGEPQIEDNPFDPDTTYEGQDAPSQNVSLITDYKYDNLYRVIEVKTPNSKIIKYWYDALGRQSQRETPDAGITNYWYDRNNNLTYTQDEVQRDFSPQKYTFRTYDGLNRLLTISEETPTDPNQQEDNPTSGNCFIINCYDSLAYAPVGSIFTNVPSDYYGTAANNTKGSIVATAYKTKLSDSWSYKFYRYDARGRVIKFWHYIAGLGWKTENYYYNSMNQLSRNWYQPNQSDGKVFINTYDDAARLQQVDLYLGSQPGNPEEDDAPSSYYKLTGYTYNANSQIATHKLNLDQYTNTYTYNNRNWIQQINASPYIFRYVLLYNANGNIRFQSLQGDYNNNFSDQDDYYAFYTYDQSNKLTFAEYKNPSASLEGKVINAYDKDGNLVMLKRKDASDNSIDDFSYEYYNGKNRLKKVTGTATQYNYDDNGNMLEDKLNNNYNCLYDYRNLMTDIKTIRQESSGGPVPQEVTYWTVYKYDEAGNRVRKSIYKYTGSQPDPIYEDGGDNPSWQSVSDEYYVRDILGKEIAIYSSTNLQFWNIWGLDNVGKINSDTTKNYYLKDHLGSIHAVINSTNTVISAQDYDSWGYVLPNRSYNLSSMKYDYTSKERDTESNYDYFGARYYDSRIGRWNGVESKLSKHIAYTPYCYSGNNPIVMKDIDGRDWTHTITNDAVIINVSYSYTTEGKYGLSSDKLLMAQQLIADANERWNKAAENMKFDNKKVIFSFYINPTAMTESDFGKKLNSMIRGTRDGDNLILNSESQEVKMNRGFELILGTDIGTYPHRGAHEAGHAMGLSHPEDMQDPSTIMSYSIDRDVSVRDVNDILKQIDLSKATGAHKGTEH